MKNRFRAFVSVVLLLIMIISGIPVSAASSDDGVMRENITSHDYANDMGLGLNLGNTMEAYNVWDRPSSNKTSGCNTVGLGNVSDYETCWGAVVTSQKIIDGIKAAGFNNIRIPVYWGNGMKDDGRFKISDDLLKRVKEIVDYSRNAGLYVVINIHHYDGYILENYSKENALKIFKSLWKQIAIYFRDYSDYVIFEGFNESLGNKREKDNYTDSQMFEYVNTLNQTFVDAVRSTGGNNAKRMLIASGYWTNIDLVTKPSFKMPTDTVEDRLMISVHYVDNGYYWAKQIGSDSWYSGSIKQCEALKKTFTDKGYVVYIGECTANYPDENFAANPKYKTSSECLDIMLDMMLDYGFIPVIWDTPENFYSRKAYTIIDRKNADVIKSIAADLNEKSGKKMAIKAQRESANNVRISWNETDGAVSYNVYRCVGNGKKKLIAGKVKNTEYLDTTAKTGFDKDNSVHYSYFVSSVDKKGVESKLSVEALETGCRDVIVDSNDSKVVYDGQWSLFTEDDHYMSTNNCSWTAGSTAELTFVGRGIELYSVAKPNYNGVNIYIDGKQIGDYYLVNASSKTPDTLVFSKTDLEYGEHTIKVVVMNKIVTGVRDNSISIDYFKVFARPE